MTSGLLKSQLTHPAHFDEEIIALALQLEEIQCYSDSQKGKYKENNVPDMQVAFATFQMEVQRHLQFLDDLKYAHSVARAVDSDAQAISEIAQVEAQEERDRRLALQMSGQNPDQDAPPPYIEVGTNTAAPEDEVKLLISLFRVP
jgi:hypothetical protein